MKRINLIILFFRSLLSKDEKRLLERTINKYKEGNGYKLSNYNECRRLVEVGYKLEDRMDYLCKKGQLQSDEYKNTRNKYQCINVLIREYSLSV